MQSDSLGLKATQTDSQNERLRAKCVSDDGIMSPSRSPVPGVSFSFDGEGVSVLRNRASCVWQAALLPLPGYWSPIPL
jgi:hypothetical protein